MLAQEARQKAIEAERSADVIAVLQGENDPEEDPEDPEQAKAAAKAAAGDTDDLWSTDGSYGPFSEITKGETPKFPLPEDVDNFNAVQ